MQFPSEDAGRTETNKQEHWGHLRESQDEGVEITVFIFNACEIELFQCLLEARRHLAVTPPFRRRKRHEGWRSRTRLRRVQRRGSGRKKRSRRNSARDKRLE